MRNDEASRSTKRGAAERESSSGSGGNPKLNGSS